MTGARAAASTRALRVLILYAGVGHGHRVAAEGVAGELRRSQPSPEVALHDGFGARRSLQRLLLERLTRWQLLRWPRTYHVTYALAVRWPAGRRVALALLCATSRRPLLALIAAEKPDVIVSTYPGLTACLGRLRERADVDVPVSALVTDLASLHFWAHPGVDIHLAAYPESLEEIARISGSSTAYAVRPPLLPEHWLARGRAQAREALSLDRDAPVVLISGGGWGIGDLSGAIAAALQLGDVQVVVVCGENRAADERLRRAHAREPRVRVLGHTRAMPDLLRAADVLVHSTGGVTCLEAAAHGCPVIAYGFSYGHVHHNVRAMVRLGLGTSASTPNELIRCLLAALTHPPARRPPDGRPTAASLILALATAPAADLEPARQRPVQSAVT
jgi:processive 1,2-diacylglycerol beta-glucosyltransferase